MTGNQLKILALVSMTLDHIGVVMFPSAVWLRIAGRLALPIFAFMIAEGCFYTRSKRRYLGGIVALGVLCQLVFWFAQGSLEQSILTTFALSMLVVFALQKWWDERSTASALLLVCALALDAFACYGLPQLLGDLGWKVDYGFWGTMLAVLAYLPRLGMTREDAKAEKPAEARRRRAATLALLAAGVLVLAFSMRDVLFGVQWWGLAALAFLALYNGQRGKLRLKYLFYVYYPLHLAAIYGIALLVQ